MMKRILALLMVLAITFSMAACGQEAPVASNTPSVTPSASGSATPEPSKEPASKELVIY